jgi:hypothetical protein
MLPGHPNNPTEPCQCAGCSHILQDTTGYPAPIPHMYRTRTGYWIYQPGSQFPECDSVTNCDVWQMNCGWVGDHYDCASLCANFVFTNFTSSTCYKALHYPDHKNCLLFLWDALTGPSKAGGVVLSDCAFHVQSVCVP